ncbi:MAG: glycosyltransferase family 4 protein [Salinirussus sp.]
MDATTGSTPRVFHLITRLLNGGAEGKTIGTVRGMDGYAFTVGFGASHDPTQVARLHELGADTRRFPLLRHYNPATALPAVASVAAYLRRREFDIVHTHSTEAGIIGRAGAALAGVPAVVHTVHGVPFSTDRSRLLNRFVLACERQVAPVTDRIVTNADAIAEEYLSRGIGEADQYVTIYSGIDTEAFADAEPAADLDPTGPVVLMVARLAEGKGFDVLFDAVERLADREFSVYVAGDGPLSDALAADIEARGLDRVSLLGYREDVPRLLAASDVFVLPSFREGTPRVITEAMASGLPVVATSIAGIPEQVDDGETGLLVPPGDPAALADCIERLLADENRRERMGDRARDRVQRFSAETMCADLDALYRELLDRDQ